MRYLPALFVVLLLVSCNDGTQARRSNRATSYKVKYEVTGSAKTASLTYNNHQGATEQKGEVQLPWDYEFSAEKGMHCYISAQNQGASGDIEATIFVNGKEVKSSHSEGAYVIATASGHL
jgi:hypothetical protein